MPKKSDVSGGVSSGKRGRAFQPEAGESGTGTQRGRAAEPKAGTMSVETGRKMKGVSRTAAQPEAERAPAKGMKTAAAEETGRTGRKVETAPGKPRGKVILAEEKAEKTLAKKGTLGKIAKVVTEQVSAIARKVSGKEEGAKTPKGRGRKAAGESTLPAEASVPPSSRSGRSAGKAVEATAASTSPESKAGSSSLPSPRSAPAKGALTQGEEAPPVAKKAPAPKKAASRKSARPAEAGEPQVAATVTDELIRPEQEIQTPAPSDVREQIFHERYAHVPPPPPRDLPGEYGDTRIVLLVRDPEWVYAYWEVNDSTRQELRIPRSGHNRRMVVRLYKITGRNWPEEAAHYFFDVEVSPYAQNWYIKLPETAQQWCAELGMFNEEGEYLPIVRSNVIATPRDTVSPETDADWMTVEEVYEKLYGISAGYAAANAVLRGAAGRGASEQLLRHLQRQIAAGLRGQIDLSSGGLYSGASESVTSPGRGGVGKDFWLQVHTELILYGSTEPDARVTVQGRPVKLNPDGTFSLRYALPDGEQVLRVHAVSRDGDMEREVTPVVTRTTRKKD